jgi:hypothetical protein
MTRTEMVLEATVYSFIWRSWYPGKVLLNSVALKDLGYTVIPPYPGDPHPRIQ